jgi:catechol 2,3-dioxygenase-like lactoylglutathione lyase family enzyme
MKLNQINLPVNDVPEARAFLERYFDMRGVGEAHKNFQLLVDDDGFVLTLMGVGPSNEVSYPRTFHLGSIQRSKAEVDQLNERLRNDGHEVELPSMRHGHWTFYVEAPGGVTIAVSADPGGGHG